MVSILYLTKNSVNRLVLLDDNDMIDMPNCTDYRGIVFYGQDKPHETSWGRNDERERQFERIKDLGTTDMMNKRAVLSLFQYGIARI